MCDIVDETNKYLERFRMDTGIWPPGRDMPMAMGVLDAYDVQQKAFHYWRGVDSQIAALTLRIDTLVELSDALRAENEQLRAAIGSPEVCAGVVSEVVELQRDIAVKNCGLLREQLAAAQSKANNTQQKGSTDD